MAGDSKPKIDMTGWAFVECANGSNKWAANWKSPAHVVRALRSRWYCLATGNQCHDIKKENSGEVQEGRKENKLCCEESAESCRSKKISDRCPHCRRS